MPLLAKNLDYTDRDFDAIKARTMQLIRSVYPSWTDFNVANFGNVLLDVYAFVGDNLAFYQDNQANESRIATVTQRKNLIALCKLIGFVPEGAKAATVDVVFTLRAPPIGNVTLNPGQIVSTADITAPIEFQLLTPLVILAGSDPPTATASVENSESQEDVFTSTGLPNQSFLLANGPYLDDSAIPTASDGVYTLVDSFLESDGTDKHFTVVVDQNDKATLVFGNGVNGKIPVGTITVGYKTGGGETGNVEPGTVNRIPGSFTDAFGNPVQITVTNPAKAGGGVNRQTNEQIKSLAPATLSTLGRSVAREDFEVNALTNPSVARALMTTSNEDPAVQENAGVLYVVPVGGGPPSQALKDAVRGIFISTPSAPAPYPSTLTFSLAVQDPLYLAVNHVMTVWFRAGVAPAVGAKAIRDALTEFYRILLDDGTPNPRIDFGYNFRDADGNFIGSIPLGDVFDAVHDVPEVLRVGGKPTDFLLNGAHTDVPILAREFPKLGTVTIINGVDGSLV